MATTGTLVELEGQAFPFIGIGIPPAQFPTYLPSAEFVFSSTDAITIAAAGEDQSLLVTLALPRSFCYVLVECSVRIESIDGDNWDQEAISNLFDSSSVPELLIPLALVNQQLGHSSTATTVRTYQIAVVPTKVIVPLASNDARLDYFLTNTTIDGGAGLVRTYARFLRYDRVQAQFWQINTPLLTR